MVASGKVDPSQQRRIRDQLVSVSQQSGHELDRLDSHQFSLCCLPLCMLLFDQIGGNLPAKNWEIAEKSGAAAWLARADGIETRVQFHDSQIRKHATG